MVPIASGGTAGDTAYYVFGYQNGKPTALFVRKDLYKVGLKVEQGQLAETLPIYGPNDPNCCPSQLKTIFYRWDGSTFVQAREETRPNPNP